MRRVGEVVRTAQGLAVARCEGEEFPAVGTEVVDENLDDVGTIVDVFGPVDRPYLAIDAQRTNQVPGLLGQALYAR